MRRDLTNFKARRGNQFKEGFNWFCGECAGALEGPVWGVTLPAPAERQGASSVVGPREVPTQDKIIKGIK